MNHECSIIIQKQTLSSKTFQNKHTKSLKSQKSSKNTRKKFNRK